MPEIEATPLLAGEALMESPQESTLAANLRLAMSRVGYTRNALAVAARVKPDVVRDIFRRNAEPSAGKLEAIAHAIGYTTPQLLGREPMPDAPHAAEATGLERPSQLAKNVSELVLLAFWRGLDEEEQMIFLKGALKAIGRDG